MKRTAALLCLVLALPAIGAEPTARDLQLAITGDGNSRCDRVANVRWGSPRGVDNGDLLVVVDCLNGGSHVVRITPDGRVNYYMDCKSLLNPVRC